MRRTETISRTLVGSDALRITVRGAPGYSHQVQSTTDPAAGSWETIGIVTADSAGVAYHDTTLTPEARFSRIVYP